MPTNAQPGCERENVRATTTPRKIPRTRDGVKRLPQLIHHSAEPQVVSRDGFPPDRPRTTGSATTEAPRRTHRDMALAIAGSFCRVLAEKWATAIAPAIATTNPVVATATYPSRTVSPR